MILFRYFLLVCLLWLPLLVAGQAGTQYTVSFPNLVHREALITATFTGVPQAVLEARMARSSPGRYALHEFAKNVYAVKAEDGKGNALKITRPNPHQWNVSGHDGTVKITYTLFGDRTDGTYASINETHAHLNAPATFMYAHGFEASPITAHFQMPAGKNWTIATQLKPEPQAYTFSAPDLQYFMDSPVEIAELAWQEWQVTDKGKTKTIRFALHHNGTPSEFEKFAAETKKVVQQAQAVFGELPNFDFGIYTFIACYLPHADGDGMEHRNSTFLTSARPLKTGATQNLGTVSHEFFHAWNVERLRPKSLEPFNFAEANMSEALWFAEGFTSYYGDLLLCRSGALSQEAYVHDLGRTLSYYLSQPGKDHYSPVEMSRQAPFVDAARPVDPVNRLNTYVSHYTHGEVLALALDLTLRSRYETTLDAYMKRLWQTYGASEKPFTLPDLELTLAQITKDEPFASEFFQKHIYGHVPLDFKSLLREAGLDLRPAKPGQASLGYAPLTFTGEKASLQTGTLLGSPLYLAGADNGAVLLKLDGKKLQTEKDLAAILKKHKPGNKVALEFEQFGQVRTAEITLIEDPQLELVITGKDEKTKAFRAGWLQGKSLE